MTAALGSGSAPLPPCHSHGAGRPAWSWAAPPAASKPPASPPVALPRLQICAPTRLQVPDGMLFAIKCLNRSRIVMATQSGRLAKEIRLLKLLNHPNVIRLHEVLHTQAEIMMVMECAAAAALVAAALVAAALVAAVASSS